MSLPMRDRIATLLVATGTLIYGLWLADLPNGLTAVGYGQEDIPGLVDGALQQQRLLATAPLPVTADDLTSIFADSLTLW